MRARSLVAALLLLLLLLACRAGAPTIPTERAAGPRSLPSISPSPSPSPSPPSPPAFNRDRAMAIMRHLAVDIGPRHAGSPAESKGADYLARTMTETGLDVRTQAFKRADGGTSVNVIGRVRGSDYTKGYLLVGGHYDTVPGSPGANDNASGTAVVVALGEALLRIPDVPVELVAFAAEEVNPSTKKHHEGSLAYIAEAPDLSKIAGMISVDMIGDGSFHYLVDDSARPSKLDDELSAIATGSGIPVRPRLMGDVSDHTSFTRRGVPGILLYSGSTPYYHSPRDRVEVVEPDAVDRAGRLVLAWLLSKHHP